MKIIEVTISPQGESRVETKGYAGAECLNASKWLEQVLGTTLSSANTAEFYATTNNQQHQENQA